MQDHQGLFFVLEGTDGSGKTTQFKLLTERLKAVGYDVALFDFPRYNEPSSYFVKRYLNGQYGPASEISPYTASMFYAMDRYEAASAIKQAQNEGKIVLANRYVGSNMAHQGSKFSNESEQRGFFIWADSLEFQLLGLPRPTLSLYLRLPPQIAYDLIAKKAQRSYTDKKRDEHEKDINHLSKSTETYDLLTKLFPKDFKQIDCSDGQNILSVATISDKIWQIVKPLLPPNPPNKGQSVTLKLDNQKDNFQPLAQPKSKEDSKTARPPSDDLQIDNISLLAASNLMESINGTKLSGLRWTNAKSKTDCQYFVPEQLDEGQKLFYTATLDKIADNYLKLRLAIANLKSTKTSENQLMQAAKAVIPLASMGSITFSAAPDYKKLKSELTANTLDEVTKFTNNVSSASRLETKISDVKSDEVEPQSIDHIIKQLVEERLPQNLSSAGEPIKLLEFNPKNEIDLLLDSLYSFSDLSRDEIASELDKWAYAQKAEALDLALAKDPAVLTNQVSYHWDAISDRLELHNLLNRDLAVDIRMQSFTPRYGYEVPEPIETDGLEELYINCFDLSLELYSFLQSQGQPNLAGYATLLGHKVRWQFCNTADKLIGYFSEAQNETENLSDLSQMLKEKINEVHPHIGALFNKKGSPKVKKSAKKSSSTGKKKLKTGKKAKDS